MNEIVRNCKRRYQKDNNFCYNGDALLNKKFICRNVTNVIVAFNTSFLLFFIVIILVGECPHEKLSYAGSQSCNPFVKSNIPPVEMIFIMFFAPFFFQMVFQYVPISVVFILWMINLLVAFWSLVYMKAQRHYYLIAYVCIVFSFQCLFELTKANILSSLEKMIEKQYLIMQNEMEKIYTEKEKRLIECYETKMNNNQILSDLEIKKLKQIHDEKLQAYEQSVRQAMVGNIAHDLRTPVHSVRMDVQQLKKLLSNSKQQYPEFFELDEVRDNNNPLLLCECIESSCDFMAMGINRFVEYEMTSRNVDLKPKMETFDISYAIMTPIRCIQNLLPENEKDRIVIHSFNQPELLHNARITSDMYWLQENILCLLSNAAKYSYEHSRVVVDIDLVTEVDCICDHSSDFGQEILIEKGRLQDKFIRVSVKDNGVGISESDRKLLFESVRQTERVTVGGMGLGLHSLSNRIKALKGYHGMKPRSDGLSGSIFWFAFPYRQEFEISTKALICSSEKLYACQTQMSLSSKLHSTPVDHPPIQLNLFSLKFLVVDDSLSVRKVTTRTLESNGHQVEVAKDGSLGLQRMKQTFLDQDFDILLTDIQMPNMDGFTFTQEFRKYEKEMLNLDHAVNSNRKCRNSKGNFLIIGMSANSDVNTNQQALDSGMDHFMTKPFTYEELVQVVKQFI